MIRSSQSAKLDRQREKLRQLAAELGLGGLANDTKWRELVAICCSQEWSGPLYRYKCIDAEQVSTWNAEWEAIPQPSASIEWLDIYTTETIPRGLLPQDTIDHAAEIGEILSRIGFEFQAGKSMTRVYGYSPYCTLLLDEELPT